MDPSALDLVDHRAVTEGRLVEDRVRGEDPDPDPDGQGERVGRPGVDLDRRPSRSRRIRAWKVSSARSLIDDPVDPGAERLEGRREQVVGQRAAPA